MKKSLEETLPHFTVMAIPFDPLTGDVALLWRGDKVRSAKNCLSTPAGLLEHSESFAEGISRELNEEMKLDPNEIHAIRFRTIYRNENGDGFDWVIGVWQVDVFNLRDKVVNAEPDKHDSLVFMNVEQFLEPEPVMEDGRVAKFATNLQLVLREFAHSIFLENAIRNSTIAHNYL